MPPLKTPTGDLREVQILLVQTSDARLYKRLLAVLSLMEGRNQQGVAEELKVSLSTLREWVRRWNKGGVEALKPRNHGLSREEMEYRQGLLENGIEEVKMGKRFVAYRNTSPFWKIVAEAQGWPEEKRMVVVRR
ncbi:MAG: helix-turn-helix domain-containing protein [Myxococcales bacterium]|nr:MAG: helix-turn-helix domain-containing protein [Myxococcales bacterium]